MSLHQYQKPSFIKNTQQFINGEFINSVNGKQNIQVINPSDASVICKVTEATQQDLNNAVDQAQNCFDNTWSFMQSKDRSQFLEKMAQNIQNNLKEYVELESLNTGRPLNQSEFEIQQVIDILKFYSHGPQLQGKTFNTQQQNQLQYTIREPLGIIGIIGGWSSSFLNSIKIIAPALAAGNVIVQKGSEITPLPLLRFAQTVQEVGLPSGVYNILIGYGPIVGDALVKNKKVRNISYFGSSDTGKLLLQNSIQDMKKVRCQMNGKAPIIIGPDVDVVGCANLAFASSTYNMGQNSLAGSRLLIHEQVFDKFIANIKKIAQNPNTNMLGDPFQGAAQGPLINKFQLEKCHAFLDRAVSQYNAKILCGGKQGGNFVQQQQQNSNNSNQNSNGYFIQPTVLIDFPDTSDLSPEELLAPVIQILKPWKTVSEVIERANKSDYGLSAIVMTQDMGSAQNFIQKLNFGKIYVNCWSNPLLHMPFNPNSQSGSDQQGGEDYINEYTKQKAVYYQINSSNLQ